MHRRGAGLLRSAACRDVAELRLDDRVVVDIRPLLLHHQALDAAGAAGVFIAVDDYGA